MTDYACNGKTEYTVFDNCRAGSSDKYMYSIIFSLQVLRAESPLRLFFDVEWLVEGFGDDTQASEKLASLLQHVQQYGRGHSMLDDPVVLNASRCGKQSYHIIYPNAVFKTIDVDLKTFVLGFVRWLIEDKKVRGLTYLKQTKRGEQLRCIVDTAVYTKNRCFRMLGQSKATDKTGTKLAGSNPDSVLIPADTLVQSCDLKCVHAADIDKLLTYRAPKDGLYPIYPSPDFGNRARDKGTVCIKMHSGQDRRTNELVVCKKLGRLVIKKDQDILDNLDADELKQADFVGWFLPILSSLTASFSDEKLTQWMGGQTSQKITARLIYARRKGREDKVAVVKCEAGLAFLKKKHVQVVDMRADCMLFQPLLQVVDPAQSKGWGFVKTGQHLKDELNRLCFADKRSTFQRKRAFYISGKMGAGKTGAVLEFAKEKLAGDVYKHVTYFGPRTVLVKQVSERMEAISLASTVNRKKGVIVHRYYTGMDDDAIYLHGVKCRQVQYNNNIFHAACINSAGKTPVNPDLVIVDEAVVDVGNMFICSTQSRRSRKGDSEIEQAITYDRVMIEAVIERVRNAAVVIYIDAAFTQHIIEAFSLIWSTLKPFNLGRYSGKERRALRTSLGKAKGKDSGMTFRTDRTGRQKFQVAGDVRLAVYDPARETGIFTQLQEFANYQLLKSNIIASLANHKSCIVYTSSSRTATDLMTMVKRKGVSPVPMMTLVTAEFVKQTKDVEKCINDMNSSVFVAASNVLSCGVSFEQQDMFDTAFAVFEFSPNTPPLADMIQLCARVRSVSSKTLKYTVISRGSKYYASRDSQDVFALRHKELAASPVCVAFHKLNEAEHTDHISMCRQRGYAAVCVRRALTAAFTHIRDPKEAPVVPEYTIVEPLVAKSNQPTRAEVLRYVDMCRDLPAGTTYQLYQGTKRPVTVTRNDLPAEAYVQAPFYELAEVEKKNGVSNAVEPIPSKKQKRDSISEVYDSELAEQSEQSDNELESNDESECRGDI